MNKTNVNEAIAYAHGHITAWIELFARSTGHSEQAITTGLGELLQPEGPGIEHNLSSLRKGPTKLGYALEQVEVDERSHRQPRRISAQGRARIATAQRKRWAKAKSSKGPAVHAKHMSKWWKENFPTPELRAKEVARRMKVRRKKALKKAA